MKLSFDKNNACNIAIVSVEAAGTFIYSHSRMRIGNKFHSGLYVCVSVSVSVCLYLSVPAITFKSLNLGILFLV